MGDWATTSLPVSDFPSQHITRNQGLTGAKTTMPQSLLIYLPNVSPPLPIPPNLSPCLPMSPKLSSCLLNSPHVCQFLLMSPKLS